MLGLASRKACWGGIPCSGCVTGANVWSRERLRSVLETLSEKQSEVSIRGDYMSHLI